MKRVLAFCFIGAVGVVIFLVFYPLAFPEASINFRIRPSEALERGRQAIQQLGGPDLSKGYISAVDFRWDESVKRYLEKTMGLEKANEVMEREIFLWHYYCVWQRPGDRHLYRAGITPDGRVLGAEIVLPEEVEGAFLPEQEARKVAEVFLRERIKVNLSDWRFVSATHAKRPNRSDYTFTYEHRYKKFPANQNDGATLRLWVDISGDKVTGYYLNYLHLPERWEFEEGRRQTQRIVLSVIFRVAYALLTLALIGWFTVCVARKELILWRLGLIVGGIIATLTFVTGLNFATLWWFSYDPSKPVSVFLTSKFISLLLGTLVQLFFYSGIALVGEQLSREQPPMGIPLSVMLRPKFWTTKEAVVALTIGICFGLAKLGYVTAFYLLGRKVGVWTPLEIPYTDAVVTPLPFLAPLYVGLSPALKEELFFRLAAPYLLWRWTKRWWLSMLLPGIIWAFLHVGYPPEPAFIRGLELTVLALGYAWIMQRYGFTAPIVAHFTYNAVLESQLLLRSDETFFRFSGIVPFAIFLVLFLPAAIVYLKYRRLPSASEVPPFTPMPIPKEPFIQPVPYAPYQPISRKNWLALIALCTIGAVTPFLSREHENFKPVALMKINRWEVQRIASDYLKRKGVPVERYRIASNLLWFYRDDDLEENAYLLEHAGKEALYRFWKNEKPPVFWVVRFFRPYDREVWSVILDPSGQVWNFSHSLPEEAKGAMLTQKHAVEIAENYLRKEKRINLSEWKLVETDHENLPNRRDWTLIYEHKTRKVNDATLRLRVDVQGDQAQSFWIWWEVPEEWMFEREQFKAWGDLVFVCLLVLALPSIIYMGICDWRERAVRMNWRLALKMMLPFACLVGLQILNATANMWVSYPTNLPPTAWLLMFFLISGILATFVVFAVSASIGGFEPNWMSKRLPEMVPLSIWLSRHRKSPDLMETPVNHPAAIRDAIAFGYLASFALWSLFEETELNALLLRSSWLPILDYLAWTVWAVVILIFLGIGFAGIYRRYIRTLDRLFILLLVLLPIGLLGIDSPEKFVSEFAKWSAGLFATAGILYWLGRFVLRHNLYAWTLGIALSMLLAVSVQLLQAPDLFWKAQAVPLLALYALPALLWMKQKSNLTYPTFQLTQK